MIWDGAWSILLLTPLVRSGLVPLGDGRLRRVFVGLGGNLFRRGTGAGFWLAVMGSAFPVL